MSISPCNITITNATNNSERLTSLSTAPERVDGTALPNDEVTIGQQDIAKAETSTISHKAPDESSKSSAEPAKPEPSADAQDLVKKAIPSFMQRKAEIVCGTEGDDNIHITMGENGSLLVDINGTASSYGKEVLSQLVIDGGKGNDRIIVDESVTVGLRLTGGEGDDYIIAGSGNDFIFDNYGSNVIHGGAGNDVIIARGLDNKTNANGFANELHGDDGNDYLEGGNGRDLLHGGNGYDVLYGLGGDDELHGGEGNDYIDGGAGNDTIYGEGGNDNLIGGQGDDKIYGGAGDDLLIGSSGNDTLDGGEGANKIISDGANDKIVANPQNTVETIAAAAMPANLTVRGEEMDQVRLMSDMETLAHIPHGHLMFSELGKTPHPVSVATTHYGSTCTSFDGDTTPGVGSKSFVHYNTFKVSFENKQPWADRAPIVVLFHELCHSYNAATGTMDKTYYDYSGNIITEADHKGPRGVEYQAVGIDNHAVKQNPRLLTENSIRELFGHQERTKY